MIDCTVRTVCFCVASRLKPDALKLFEILNEYEKRHIVEILSYHDCDTPSRPAPDLDCLVDLQARFIKQRHLIFLTGALKQYNDNRCLLLTSRCFICIVGLYLPVVSIICTKRHFVNVDDKLL